MRFAAELSELNLNFFAQAITDEESGTAAEILEDDCCSECSDEVTTKPELVDDTVEVGHESVPVSNLSSSEFPLLSSLGVHTDKHLDKLLQEVVKLYGRTSIHYLQANNRSGWLIPFPSLRTC